MVPTVPLPHTLPPKTQTPTGETRKEVTVSWGGNSTGQPLVRGEQATYTSFSDPRGLSLWREGAGEACPGPRQRLPRGALSPQWGPEVLSCQPHRGLAEHPKVEEHPSRDTPHNLVLRARDPHPHPEGRALRTHPGPCGHLGQERPAPVEGAGEGSCGNLIPKPQVCAPAGGQARRAQVHLPDASGAGGLGTQG